MSDNTLNTARNSASDSNRLAERKQIESAKTGKVAIDRYLEALRKEVILSQ